MSKLQVDDIVNKDDTGSAGFSKGAVITGIATATSFDGNLTGTSSGLAGTPDIAVGTITAQNILPDGNGTRDLGATGTRWANLYTSDIDLSNESKGGNEIDGTWGSYTIQEGEENLFLINRRSGKRYKFVLEEVD